MLNEWLKHKVEATFITGYLWKLEKPKTIGQSNKWSDLSILNADTCQGDEWEIVIVKTSDSPSFIGDDLRANVVTSRAREVEYFSDNWTRRISPLWSSSLSDFSDRFLTVAIHDKRVTRPGWLSGL